MPLIKSPSKEAVGTNISREMEAGRPRKQAIAIALETQRRAGGGNPKPLGASSGTPGHHSAIGRPMGGAPPQEGRPFIPHSAQLAHPGKVPVKTGEEGSARQARPSSKDGLFVAKAGIPNNPRGPDSTKGPSNAKYSKPSTARGLNYGSMVNLAQKYAGKAEPYPGGGAIDMSGQEHIKAMIGYRTRHEPSAVRARKEDNDERFG
jgi:hypothetical protein